MPPRADESSDGEQQIGRCRGRVGPIKHVRSPPSFRSALQLRSAHPHIFLHPQIVLISEGSYRTLGTFWSGPREAVLALGSTYRFPED